MPKNTKKDGKNWIYAYYQEINSGAVCVGRWIRLVYQYIVKCIEDKEIVFDQEAANDAVEWIEEHCFHVEGPLAPGPLTLETWQKAIVSCIFGLKTHDNNPQFREVVLIVARKNGKSAFASAIAKYVFQQAGGFGAKIFCLAPKLDQADIVYNNIWQMILCDPEYQEAVEAVQSTKDAHNKKTVDDSMIPRHRQSDLCITGTNSTVKKIAFNAKKSDGFNPSLTICDEIASWSGDKGLKQYEVMKSAMGAREDSFMLSCSTSGYENDSIYDELMKRSTRFLLGDSEEKSLLPFLYIIDDVEKWNDINELRKSNPNLGVSVSVNFFLSEIAVAKGSLSKKAEFLTKYCNIKQNSSLAWLPAEAVQKASGASLSLESFRGCYCVVGVDLSRTTDLTAVTVLIERDNEIYIIGQFFMPRETMSEASARDNLPYEIYAARGFVKPSGDNFVDYHDCYEWICDLVRKYKIYPLKIMYDRYSAQYLIQDLQGAGFQTDDCYQGENMTPGIREFEGLIKNGTVHIGDNDLLKIHLLNAALKMNNETERVKLVKLNATAHVDGVAAILDAMIGRQKWWNEIGAQLSNKR